MIIEVRSQITRAKSCNFFNFSSGSNVDDFSFLISRLNLEFFSLTLGLMMIIIIRGLGLHISSPAPNLLQISWEAWDMPAGPLQKMGKGSNFYVKAIVEN